MEKEQVNSERYFFKSDNSYFLTLTEKELLLFLNDSQSIKYEDILTVKVVGRDLIVSTGFLPYRYALLEKPERIEQLKVLLEKYTSGKYTKFSST